MIASITTKCEDCQPQTDLSLIIFHSHLRTTAKLIKENLSWHASRRFVLGKKRNRKSPAGQSKVDKRLRCQQWWDFISGLAVAVLPSHVKNFENGRRRRIWGLRNPISRFARLVSLVQQAFNHTQVNHSKNSASLRPSRMRKSRECVLLSSSLLPNDRNSLHQMSCFKLSRNVIFLLPRRTKWDLPGPAERVKSHFELQKQFRSSARNQNQFETLDRLWGDIEMGKKGKVKKRKLELEITHAIQW